MLSQNLLIWSCWIVTAFTHPAQQEEKSGSCSCEGTKPGEVKGKYICNDPRLGPLKFPTEDLLSNVVQTYNRFGGLSPGDFLKKWIGNDGKYAYPEQNGFQLDANGKAINGSMVLLPGTIVDRFGDENGQFIAAAVSPFSQRSLPPSALDVGKDEPYDYHVYEVVKDLKVVGGPIAPWFGQPGLGAQFYTGIPKSDEGRIYKLVENGYLKRLKVNVFDADRKGCD